MSKKVKTSYKMKVILVVEDSATQAAQIKYLLEIYQFKVIVTQNGRQALVWLSKHKPSLVISDILMPEMNGFELCERIKSDERTEDIPVILLTSLSDPDEVIEGLSCGADSFITKPYNNEYLISNIEQTLTEKATPESKRDTKGIEINYSGKKRLIRTRTQKVIKLLLNIYQGAIHQNNELIQTRDELRLLNERLEDLVEERTRADELIIANKELAFQNEEKQKRADELIIANKELAFQNEEKQKRANELITANKELVFQNREKEKRADELIIANKELAFQNEEKQKRADELIIANKELAFQNEEKEKRANELITANERIREINEYLENLLNYMNAPIIVWDTQYKITRFNRAFESITGRIEKDMVGKSLKILFPVANRDSTMDLIKKTLTGDRLKVVEIDILHIDGSVQTLLWNSANIMSPDGKTPVATIAQGLNITQRKQAEEALKISKERLLFATEGANIGIWNWNIVTDELIWSDQCKALFGVPPDETMSYQRFSDALHPDDRERTDKAVKDTLDNHKDFDIEYRSLWPDESIHWLAAKGRGFYDATGKAVRLEGIVMDIAESKREEEEIRKLNAELEDRVAIRTSQLEATNKELEAFSYSVSHDLRAPLRHVSGYVDLLNKHFLSDLPEKGQHYLNSVADSVRMMGVLIDDLLQFSRTGRLEMHQSDFDMNEIVKETIDSLCKDNPDRKIEWVVRKLVSVYGDEAMLRLVWMNLLSNAVKFTRTRKKARIEIGVREENKELVFFVRDNGIGFDMQYAQKLFGVFQRLHPTEEFEGTGIGLANVHRIVLRHGGRTWAEAEPDKGAVFYFSISKT
jgi:PAS domain S-box-containing protein